MHEENKVEFGISVKYWKSTKQHKNAQPSYQAAVQQVCFTINYILKKSFSYFL